MLVRPTWKGASRVAQCDLIRSHYEEGHTASGLAESISLTTGEKVRRQEVADVYRANPVLDRTHPLNVSMARIREKGSAEDAPPSLKPVTVQIVGFTEDEAHAYDSAAPGVYPLDVTDQECRWPVRPGIFCGHAAHGRYCQHHTIRSRGSEQ
ncbi:hypothetical protein [Neoaquamicrobium sediminum]|uniref:hypothetical protein n=1 Tax=Neoaquamicrobium sediminum TaxID=1849104 RepID=UPI0015659D72|nr:hypothetical protein [Mesorhizobium sediminum]NRC54178.1 hypothetical protein [Mesorhizobium sediminum]